ncbi:MAG: hypothetical protein EP332_11950 [Bacteroidetes bacterium]|nr:MAG: hypothetical protein EP332_11950 [Bacteroidota bacterium]
MNTASEKIYEWLENRSFEQLNQHEQKTVLLEMSAQDYNDMHQAIRLLDGQNTQHSTRGKEAVWENITHELKEKRNPVPVWLSYRMPVGWAATVFLAMAFGFAVLYFSETPPAQTETKQILHDTLLVEVPVKESVLVHDTVYLTKKESEAKPKAEIAEVKPNQTVNASLEPELHIEMLSDSKKPANELKGNSLHYDSLAAKIGFVCL